MSMLIGHPLELDLRVVVQQKDAEAVEAFFRKHPNFSVEKGGFLQLLAFSLFRPNLMSEPGKKRSVVKFLDRDAIKTMSRLLQNAAAHSQETAKEERIADLLLAHGAPIDGIWSGMPPPIVCAARVNKLHLVSYFLQKGASCRFMGTTILHDVSGFNQTGSIPLLLQHDKTLLDEKDTKGKTPLHEGIIHGCFRFVACLLRHGASVQLQDNTNCTALFAAICYDASTSIIRALVQAGADPNEQLSSTSLLGTQGDAPLHIAVERAARRDLPSDAIKTLLEMGGNPLLENIYKTSPFDIAQVKGGSFFEGFYDLIKPKIFVSIQSSSKLPKDLADLVAKQLLGARPRYLF